MSSIDLSRAANYLITYLIRDESANTTTVRLTYHLINSKVPGVIMTPDPGTDPNPPIGDDPLNPRPRPLDPTIPPRVASDGTQHADIDDEMHVPVQEGGKLTLADVRSLMGRRYAFTPEGGGGVTELSLALADAGGDEVSAIDLSRPGAFLITYRVADSSGNTVTLHLRYVVVSGAPSVSPTNPGGSGGGNGGGGNGGDPDDGSGGSGDGRDPLPPSQVTVDPETGLSHAVVKDHVIVGTSDTPLTPDDMAAFIEEHYRIAASLGGEVVRSAVFLTDVSGRAVSAIDRLVPGVWYAEQVFTDSFGNTTTLLLTYEVREGAVDGGITNGGNNGSGAGSGGSTAGGDGASAGSGNGGDGGRGGKWVSRVRQLPQTGGILGLCPLHIVFVLIMVLASAYTLMRLRQESSGREDEACEAVG